MELHPAETTVICTDSLSVHAVLKKDNWRDCQDWTREIIIQSRRVKGFVTILWVPSHYGVDGIEEAYSLADKGTKLKQKDILIPHQPPPQERSFFTLLIFNAYLPCGILWEHNVKTTAMGSSF